MFNSTQYIEGVSNMHSEILGPAMVIYKLFVILIRYVNLMQGMASLTISKTEGTFTPTLTHVQH